MRVANEDLVEHRERKRRQRVAALEQLIDLSRGQDLQAARGAGPLMWRLPPLR
jgi:hypothetical protein